MTYHSDDPDIRDRAAAWIARLHADDCTDQDRERFLRWLHSDTRHAHTFENLTDLWEMGGGVPLPRTVASPAAGQRHGFTRRRVLACLGGGALFLTPMTRRARAQHVLETGTGGMRSVTFAGQVHCLLDTDTRLVLSSCGHPVALQKGQVVLSTETAVPLYLSVRDLALRIPVQTMTDVRIDPGCTSVTAVHGKVFLRGVSFPSGGTWIKPGQRLRIFGNRVMDMDYPDLEELLSWQKGCLIFRNSSLRDVLAEINRYIPRKIVLSAPALADRRLSAVYYIAQGSSFLQMLPRLLPLRLISHKQYFEIVPM